jgi:hypothetical protein
MRNTLRVTALLAVVLFLSSCSSDGKNKAEIKLFPVKTGAEYQYIDREGKIVINPQFGEASTFQNGLALVKTTGDEPKWGFISEDGKYTIMAQYKAATVFRDGLAWVVSENAAPTAINTKEEIKFTLHDAEAVRIYSGGLSAFSRIESNGAKWGFVDTEGRIKINPQFSNTSGFVNGRCAVANIEGKWGYIDTEGKIVINYQFEGADDFIDGRAIVVSGDKMGLIDGDGKYVINPQFSEMIDDGGRYLIRQDQKWGWCDKDGNIIINPQFSDAIRFLGNDLAPVKSGKSWGYIDGEGKIVINPQFDIAYPFNGKIALVGSNNKIGFIDESGKYVINPQYDDVSEDVISYLINGRTAYGFIETDLFNISSIVSRIDVNAPEGLSLSSKLSDVMTNLDLQEDKFKRYTVEHLIMEGIEITNDATFDFYVIANAYKEIPDGWYSRTVFNNDAHVEGYGYVIHLTNKGVGKAGEVKDALEETFYGYQLDENEASETRSVFKKDNKSITLVLKNDQIIVLITSNNDESNQKEWND